MATNRTVVQIPLEQLCCQAGVMALVWGYLYGFLTVAHGHTLAIPITILYHFSYNNVGIMASLSVVLKSCESTQHS